MCSSREAGCERGEGICIIKRKSGHPGYVNCAGMASTGTNEEDPALLISKIWIVLCLVL